MRKALGLRFAVEALFLIAVASAVALIDPRRTTILIAMASAWAAIAAFEWMFFRTPRVDTVEIPVGEGHGGAIYDGPPEPETALRKEPEPEPMAEAELPDVVEDAVEVVVVDVEAPVEEVLVVELEREVEPEPELMPEAALLDVVEDAVEVVVVDVEGPAEELLFVEPAAEPEPEPEPEPMPEPVFAPLAAAPPLEPEAPAYAEEAPAAVATAVVDIAARREGPREWNLWELERLAREQAGSDAVRDEERSFLLMYLREFADADGLLPVDFDGLVRDSFGDLLAAAGR
jgi:hypothetical protein